MQFLSFLFLLTFYPALRFAAVPKAYRQRYDQHPRHALKAITSILYWLTILLPLVVGEAIEPIGIAAHALGAVLIVSAMRVNPFFVPDATWLPGQHLVTRGVYRFCSHPGYTGMLLMCLGNVIALGTFAAFPAIAYLIVLFLHVRKENEVLRHYARQ